MTMNNDTISDKEIAAMKTAHMIYPTPQSKEIMELLEALESTRQRVKELEEVAEPATKFYKELENSDVEIPVMAALHWLGMREGLKKARYLND